MLKVNDTVYFIVHGEVMNGKVEDLEGNIFHIEGLAGCSGPHDFDLSMIGYTIFLSEKEAINHKDIPFCELTFVC